MLPSPAILPRRWMAARPTYWPAQADKRFVTSGSQGAIILLSSGTPSGVSEWAFFGQQTAGAGSFGAVADVKTPPEEAQ